MYLDYHQAEYIGGRDEQQDCAGTARLKDGYLFVLADGVGGQTGGATASRLTVETVLGAATSGAFDEEHRQRQKLRETVELANRRIHDSIEQKPRLTGMATTAVIAIVTKRWVKWVSVGDSHLYLLRGGQLRKLNEDHSYAALLVKAGKHAPGDPELDDYRNLIASALSGDEIKYVDLPERPERLQEGDILVAASDGLNTLPDKHIEALLYEKRNGNASDMATALLTAVKRAGLSNQDNATVVVARLEGAAQSSAGPVEEDEEEDQPKTQPSPVASASQSSRGALTPSVPAESRPRRVPIGSDPSPRRNRPVLAIAALVVLALFAGGAYWAFKTGLTGQGLFTEVEGPSRELAPFSRQTTGKPGVRREVPPDVTTFKCYMYRYSERLPAECKELFERGRPWAQ